MLTANNCQFWGFEFEDLLLWQQFQINFILDQFKEFSLSLCCNIIRLFKLTASFRPDAYFGSGRSLGEDFVIDVTVDDF